MVDGNHDNGERTDEQADGSPDRTSVGTIEFDTVLELCRSRHRRCVLAVLDEERRPLTINDLTKTVFTYNHHMPITEVSGERQRQIRHRLHHEHVPKLVSAGIVEFDTERQLVKPTARFDELQPHLSAIIDADPALETPVRL